MDQRTHSWIALRAIALLADEGIEDSLLELLLPCIRLATVGAWIPDQIDAKRGGASCTTENHVLKIAPYTGKEVQRFTATKPVLLQRLGAHRAVTRFLQCDRSLDEAWWGQAYKGDVPKPGQHLPNRAMALATTLKDLLLFGNAGVDAAVPGKVSFVKDMAPEARTQEEAVALYFFMLSHFVADASMPCHCDDRKLSGYSNGLHKEWEEHWADGVGAAFEKKKLLAATRGPDDLLAQTREVDQSFGLSFANAVPGLQPKQDTWLELVNVCRASFALAGIVAPPAQYPYDKTGRKAPFDTVFGNGGSQLLADLDRVVLHDAVLDTAIVWKDVWHKVSKLD